MALTRRKKTAIERDDHIQRKKFHREFEPLFVSIYSCAFRFSIR